MFARLKSCNRFSVTFCARKYWKAAQYEQGQYDGKIREYFYYLDHHGQVRDNFLERNCLALVKRGYVLFVSVRYLLVTAVHGSMPFNAAYG
jgi:hypothetical protein